MAMQWRQVGTQGEWYKMFDLPPATHQYKFIIDGQWRHDHTAPTVLDNLGNVNNCVQVQPADPSASPGAGGVGGSGGGRSSQTADGAARSASGAAEGGGGSSSSGARKSSRGATDPAGRGKAELARGTSDPYNLGSAGFGQDSYSQVVPPRDELLVHHSASLLLPPQLRLLLPHHHGDATTMPLSVQMNHTFCHINSDYSIFAIAHRFRDRSITQLLYKPNGVSPRPVIGQQLDAAAASNSSPKLEAVRDPQQLIRRNTEVRANSKDVRLQSVRISGTLRRRDQGGHGSEFVTYLVDSVLLVHGVQTTLRSERRYKHFNLLDQLLRKEFGPLVPQALPAKRAFGNLQPAFVEERRVALERYLQQCICIPALATCSLFCNFVEVSVLQSERS